MPFWRRETDRVKVGSAAPAVALGRQAPVGIESWQEKVRVADEDGPGVVGFYLDTKSALGALAPVVPEIYEPAIASWRRLDPDSQQETAWAIQIGVTLNRFSGQLDSFPSLLLRLLRLRESVGQAWIVWTEQWGFNVASQWEFTPSPTKSSGRWLTPYGTEVQTSWVWRSWVPNPYRAAFATSPLRRALTDIETMRRIMLSVQASSSSRLSRDIFWLNADPDSDRTKTLVNDYLTLSRRAWETGNPEEAAPFPMVSEIAPEIIEVGQAIDPSVEPAYLLALDNMARALNWPRQLLVEGQGASNHWNEELLNEAALAQLIKPFADAALADLKTAVWAQQWKQLGLPVDRLRVVANVGELAKKPDRAKEAIAMLRAKMVSIDEAREIAGIDGNLELPADLGETVWEIWSRLETNDRQNKSAPPEQTSDAVVVPEKPEVASVRTAAVTDVGRKLADIDRETFAELEAVTAGVWAAVAVEAAKQTIKAYPPRSVARTELRELDAGRVYAQSDPAISSAVDVGEIAAAEVDKAGEAVAEILKRRGDQIGAAAPGAVLAAGLAAGTWKAATAALVLGLLRSGGDTATATATGAFVGGPVIETMSVLGGASVDGDNRVRFDTLGAPIPAAGGVWLGTHGAATGNNVLKSFGDRVVGLTWVHGLLRTPITPFEPHLLLDGQDAVTAAGFAPYYPGDHPFCTCGYLPKIVEAP